MLKQTARIFRESGPAGVLGAYADAAFLCMEKLRDKRITVYGNL